MNPLRFVSKKVLPPLDPQKKKAQASRWLRPLLTTLALFGVPSLAAAKDSEQGSLRFAKGEAGSFTFDTGVLSGVLRREGRSTGLVPLTHKASGTAVTKGEGLFNHYRVFTRGKRYGYGARRWPSTAQLTPDGGVEVYWPETPDRPFELRAHYRWVAPNTLDLVTVVDAKQKLEAFEVVLASYFDPAFLDSRVWASRSPEGGTEPAFVSADRALGEWLAFPRDSAAATILGDGRWALEPSPLEWVHLPSFAQPVAIRRDPASGVTGLVMARRKGCFGVLTPYGKEKHFSNYLSLFGMNIEQGESAQVFSRLVVLPEWSEANVRGIVRVFESAPIPKVGTR